MNSKYNFEIYRFWLTVSNITFDRKLEYESGFDDILKIYSLRTNNRDLNKELSEKFFGNFIYFAKNGVFLRMFKSKKSWPKTRLVYLNFVTNKLSVIKKTNSSWDVWFGKDLGNGIHAIEINPMETIEVRLD